MNIKSKTRKLSPNIIITIVSLSLRDSTEHESLCNTTKHESSRPSISRWKVDKSAPCLAAPRSPSALG